MADTVQQIKDRLSIVDVVSGYVKLERAGGAFRVRCPFHAERTPSFFVSPDRGTYHCFGCQAGGDIFSFVEQIEGLDFKGALKVLAEKAGVPLVFEKREARDSRERLFELMETAAIFYTSHLTEPAREYLKKRGVGKDLVSAFRLGLASADWSAASEYLRSKKFSEKEILDAGLAKKGERGLYDRFRSRIMFPISDSAGRVVGFSGRLFPPVPAGKAADEGTDAPKYLNSPETALFKKSRILYGFDKAKHLIRKVNCAVLVEGQMDLLASHGAGWGNTVAVSGTAFTPEHANLIKRMSDNLVIALDADAAGVRAAGKAARAALQIGLRVKVAQLPKEMDPADFIQKNGSEAWKIAIRDAKDIITFLLDVLYEHLVHDPKNKIERERFSRSVETVVLPFLSDVQSPIEKDRYTREVAERLGVREDSIVESIAKLPKVPVAPIGDQRAMADPNSAIRAADRARQAFSILLWQETQSKPQLDVALYRSELEDAIGSDSLKLLEALPDKEKEEMRFSAERLYGTSTGLLREWRALLTAVAKDHLSGELAEASAALKAAELSGDETSTEELLRRFKDLSARVAQLGE